MPDIFDFITTRDEVQEPLRDTGNLPDLKPVPQINLIPTIPANYRLDKTVGTNPDALLDNLAQRISSLPDNRPAYEYTAQQERRYSNPNLQYSPYPTLGDTEDVYGRKQGGGEQLWNSVVKFGANTVGTFGSAFLTIPRQLDAVRSGNFNEFFNDDGMFEGVQNWLTGLEDKFPNYYTQWEREHPYKSALPFSGGAMNFWGDKMLKNAGFTIGGLAAGLVADTAIEIASGGTATPATFISVANHLNQAKNRMFTAMRGLNKAAIAGKVDDVVGAAKVGSLYNGIQASQTPIKTGLRYAATTYFGAQGESFIEGYHTYLDTKKQLLEEAINRGETDTQTLSEIEKRAQDAGKLTTAFNLPVLMASNLVQFPNLLYGKGAFAKNNPFIKTVFGKEGLEAVNNYSFKKDLKRWALESFKDSSAEGLEEASQYFISNSLHDYYVDRLNPNTKGQLLDFVLDNAPKVLSDPHLYEEAFLGALSGFVMGAPASIPNLTRGKSRYDSLTSNLNNVYSRFNQSNKNFTNNIELNGLTSPDETQIAAHKALYSTVHDSLKFGTYESFLDSLEDLKTIDLDSYNQTFQTEFKDDSEKLAHIQNLINESVSVRKDIEQVNKFYPTNPYTSSYLGRKVRSAFSDKTETEINNIQENLFQEFKEVVGYNQSLQRITKGKILTTEQSLKNLGTKSEAIPYLANLSRSPKGLFQYSRWKKTQIEDLRNNKTYYERLVKEGTDDSLKPRDELKNVTKRLDEVEEFYENLDKLYQKLKANPKDENIQNEILAEVLYEETNEDQREKFKEERIRQAKEFEKQNQTQAKLVEEEEDLNKPDSKTAEKIIDLNEEADDNKETVQEPIPEPVLRKNSWMNKYEEGKVINYNGQSFIIQSKTEDGMIVKGQDGTEYLVTNENGKLKFTSSIGEMGVSNNEPIQMGIEPIEPPIVTTEEPVPASVKTTESKVERPQSTNEVKFNGITYKVIGETTSRAGNKKLILESPKKTKEEIKKDALVYVFNREGGNYEGNREQFEKDYAGAISNIVGEFTAVEESRTGQITVSEEDVQWIERPQPEIEPTIQEPLEQSSQPKVESIDTIEGIEKRRQEELKPILEEIEKIEKEIEELETSDVQGAYDFNASSNSGKWNSANNELQSLVSSNKKAFTIYKLLIGEAETFKEIVEAINSAGIELQYTDRMRIADEMDVFERMSAVNTYNRSSETKQEDRTQKEKSTLSKNNLEDEVEYSVQELVGKFGLTGNSKIIWDLIRNIVNKVGIKVKFSLDRIPSNYDGVFIPATGEILIHPSTIGKGRFGEILIHEVVHALTTKIISKVNNGLTEGLSESQIKAVQGLVKLYKSVGENNNLQNQYPFQDVFEFIAHLTNDEFVKELESKDKNFLEKVVDFILDILGINNANELAKKYLTDIISDGVFLQEEGIVLASTSKSNNIQGGISKLNQLKKRLRELKKQVSVINAKYDRQIEQIKERASEPILGTEEFTWEQIFNQPDSVWVPVKNPNSNFVYSKEGDTIRKRDFENNVIGDRRYTFAKGNNQPSYIKGNFVQLIRGDEVILTKTAEEIVETELDTQIKSFLGKEYSTDYAKVLETNIALGKMKLIC